MVECQQAVHLEMRTEETVTGGKENQGDERDKGNNNPQCPMPHAQCPMPNAQCPMPHAQCPMPHSLNSIFKF
ncbi:MAG: hypothetical protein RM049_31235 [Nostoc sp. DedQUE04]|uniref:hypothetical protein n=1 Tax=Nostoc sp. DedQUE04 TaxID=3075390 RepID=UPI002AD42D62|nr:hypothetical protein [Nostoc sp. DedQUE04]MDZ8139713.1 hypothetical protein [Nostoc sp. DedQUE04]